MMAYSLAFDAENGLLLASVTGVLTKEAYLAGYEAIDRFMAVHGPCSAIFDFSAVERFDLSADFAREIANMRPVIPPGMKRIVVASQPVIYGTARQVAALRDGSDGELTVAQSLSEALAQLGITAPHFAPVS